MPFRLIALAFCLTLTACSAQPTFTANKHIPQSGPLKVHPDLLTAPKATTDAR